MKYIKGDLIRDGENFDVIGHGCNCFGTMGAGIAKDVKRIHPGAYKVDLETMYGSKNKLGTYSEFDTGKFVILNLYTQYKYTRTDVDADYDAIRSCMERIRVNYGGMKIGLPLIGAGLAGGDWKIIEKIIEDELGNEDVSIVIWERDFKNLKKFNL